MERNFYKKKDIIFKSESYNTDNGDAFFADYNNAINTMREKHKDYDTFIIFGTVKSWDGKHKVWEDFQWKDLSNTIKKAIEDCDDCIIYEKSGHLYIDGIHYDGTVNFEIKKLTDKGTDYLNNWKYGRVKGDNRKPYEVLGRLIDTPKYTKLPRILSK